MLNSLKTYLEKENSLILELKNLEIELANAEYNVDSLKEQIKIQKFHLQNARDRMKEAFLNILSESVIVGGKEI